jgi:hypothetical protein
MYCSSCGVAVAQGLSYCNHCGAKLGVERGDGAGRSSELKPELLVSAMAGVFILGLAAIALLMLVMRAVFAEPLIIAFTLLSFLLLLLVEGVLIGLLLRRTRGAKATSGAAPSKEQDTKELNAAQARGLPEPVPSVTEHTTRAFEPIYGERKSK